MGLADGLEVGCERGSFQTEHLAEDPGRLVRWRRLGDAGLGRTQESIWGHVLGFST